MGEVECPTCGETFGSRSWASRHHNTEHGETLAEFEAEQVENGVECPTCGRDDFASDRSVKIHHANVHGESIAKVDVECNWCGKPDTISESRDEEYDHYHCSEECQNAWQAEYHSGEGNPRWDGGFLTVFCAACGKRLERHPSRVERAENQFCNPRCAGNWKSENWGGESYWLYTSQTIPCMNCGEPHERNQYELAELDHYFCSRRCYRDWLPEWISGENNPNYVDGAREYGAGWTDELKERIRIRQDRECAGCGYSPDETDPRLSVHHIQPNRTFDDPDKSNDESLLIAVCPACHPVFESMAPLRPQTPFAD